MLTVHHLNNSRSLRIVWLLEELGLPYDMRLHPRNAETQRSPESLLAIHPLGKGPLLQDGSETIFESGAIIEFIINRYGEGRLGFGPASPHYGEYLGWLHFAEGSVMGPLVFDLVQAWTGGCNEALREFYEVEIIRHQRFIEHALAGKDYLVANAFSAADIQVAWVMEFAEARNRIVGHPNLKAYLTRMRARPAYQRALLRGGVQDLSVFSAGTALAPAG
jgi:glutathione S-transferase